MRVSNRIIPRLLLIAAPEHHKQALKTKAYIIYTYTYHIPHMQVCMYVYVIICVYMYRRLGVVSDKIASAKRNPVQTVNATTTLLTYLLTYLPTYLLT